jgi:hypothetical protein
MIVAVRSAFEMLSGTSAVSDDAVSKLLREISLRGMPTLKKLTAGGTMSLGELGMLLAMRVLQSEFEPETERRSLIPVVESGQYLNLIVPVDPFKNQFEDLRIALESKRGERPDLAVLSIGFADNVPVTLKITPIEVKARSGVMSAADRAASLTQASRFSTFLKRVADCAEKSELWGIAWRSLVATLLDFGFRLYGQLDRFMQQEEWAKQHSAVMKALVNQELEIEIDGQGRLFVADGTNTSKLHDLDNDGVAEVLALSHKDAHSILVGDGDELMNGVCDTAGHWNLQAAGVQVSGRHIETETEAEKATETEGAPSATASSESAGSTEAGTEFIEESTSATVSAADLETEIKSEKEGAKGDSVGSSTQERAEVAVSNQDSQETFGQLRFKVGVTTKEFATETLEFFPGNTALNQLNVGIVGDLGTGKTQLIQALLYQLVSKPESNRGVSPNVLIFDYKKDYSKPAFVKATGARVIDPFDIPLNLFSTADSLQKRNVWLERSKFFSDVLDKIYSGIGPVQRQRIKQAVKDAYERCANIGQVDPTINDVFDEYSNAQGDKIDSPYSIMSDLVDGGYFVSSSSDVIPFSALLDGVVVLDLAVVGQDDRTKNMLVAIFLNLFYDHMLRIQKKAFVGHHPQLRFVDSYLLVDEADNIMKYEFDVLKKILLQGREFGVGVMLASQYLSHFKTAHENYLEPLLTWFIHKVPNISVKELEGIGLTNVSVDLIDAVKSLECHECLYKTLGVDGRVIRAKPFYQFIEDS